MPFHAFQPIENTESSPANGLKYRPLLNAALPKSSQLLNGTGLDELREDGNIVVGLNGCSNNLLTGSNPSSTSGSSYSLSRPSNELSNDLSNPALNGKFTSPALCCLVCGDSSSGKHYGIQVRFCIKSVFFLDVYYKSVTVWRYQTFRLR